MAQYQIPLTALHARDSLRYRAALGLLQVLQEIPEWEGSRLHWDPGPILTGPGTKQQLVESLNTVYATRGADPRWRWPGIKKGKTGNEIVCHKASVERYQEMAKEFETAPHRLAWLRGTATDQATETKQGVLMTRPTAWDTHAGGSGWSVFKLAQDVTSSLEKAPKRIVKIENALFEGWTREDDLESLGWDNAQSWTGARQGLSTSAFTKISEAFAIMLALESLSMYPVHVRGGRVHTAGWSRGGHCFTYPLWREPMTARSVKALLDHPTLHTEEVDRALVHQLGITQVFRGWKNKDLNKNEKTHLIGRVSRVA